jgi:hypothetical protein
VPILPVVFGLGALVCWIIVLVKIFQNGDTVYGIVGLFCGLVAFVYGWSKADDLGVKNVMLAWTGCIIGYVISFFAMAGRGHLPQ